MQRFLVSTGSKKILIRMQFRRNYNNKSRIVNIFIRRYSPPKFELDRNWAKFCMFLAPKISLGEGPQNFGPALQNLVQYRALC